MLLCILQKLLIAHAGCIKMCSLCHIVWSLLITVFSVFPVMYLLGSPKTHKELWDACSVHLCSATKAELGFFVPVIVYDGCTGSAALCIRCLAIQNLLQQIHKTSNIFILHVTPDCTNIHNEQNQAWSQRDRAFSEAINNNMDEEELSTELGTTDSVVIAGDPQSHDTSNVMFLLCSALWKCIQCESINTWIQSLT